MPQQESTMPAPRLARRLHQLTARTVATAKPGRHGDGGGLYLDVSGTGARKWVLRFSFAGQVTEMGLGGAAVSLAQARDKAVEARKLVAAGLTRSRPSARPSGRPMASAHSANARMNCLRRRLPNGAMLSTAASGVPVDQVYTAAVLSVLQHVWQTTPETASRLRGRIEAVLDAARAKGHISRNEANPARWRGHLDKLLPNRQKLTRGHHAAMAFDGVPQFIGKLRERQAMAAVALEFLILTAARSGEVLGARWAEFDLADKVWTTPAARMKAGREHPVPLSSRALAIIDAIAKGKTGEFVFAGQKPLSGMALEMVLRRMKLEGVTVHGFRSAFRDWAGETTSFPREIAEAALAHVSGDATERADRSSDALEQRRALMEAWMAFCEPGQQSNVVPMKQKV